MSLSRSSLFLIFLTTTIFSISHQQELPTLNSVEQDSVFKVLDSINPTIPWRTIYPDDICLSAPHGIVCDYFLTTPNHTVPTPHITEMSFGYVSDFAPNPTCGPNSTLSPTLFTSFPHLRKLFFYNCFTQNIVSFPNIIPIFLPTLEELVFINNPALVNSLSGLLGNFTNLRRLVLSGNGIYGSLPDTVSDLVNLEELTLSGNKLNGVVPLSVSKLEKLKLLDLSWNYFDGNVPDQIGRLGGLIKLDLSYNQFSGKIPDEIRNLQRLEFLDLSFNRFGNFGVPLVLGEMPRLREVYLSGNLLGGVIPEIWEKLGGILGLGLYGMGLKGNVPSSLGVHLRNLCYLRLDNNSLEGELPKEFGMLERSVSELNLENNKLSGKIPFSAKFTLRVGKKLKLGGNEELCADRGSLIYCGGKVNCGDLGRIKICNNGDVLTPVVFREDMGAASVEQQSSWLLLIFVGLLFLSL